MNVVYELESKATVAEKEEFLGKLANNLLSDLFLIYGRKGYATREEKIAIIAYCEKTTDEKIQAMRQILINAKHAKSLFSALNDVEQVAAWSRTAKRLKAWKKYFERRN